MTTESAPATSPYLSLRQAVRPAILAHRLLAGDQERAGKLATECEDLLYLTGELLKAAGRARILATAPPPRMPDEGGGDRRAQLLEAYADAGLLVGQGGGQLPGPRRGADRTGRMGGCARAGQLPGRRRGGKRRRRAADPARPGGLGKRTGNSCARSATTCRWRRSSRP